MDERELKLNSLARYSKSSPLFILEEHGHCEVPAGCGGVVLRWRNPQRGVPVTMWLYAGGSCRVYLDGKVPASSRPVVPFGEHLLAFAATDVVPAHTVLMFAAVYQPDSGAHVRVRPAQPGEASVLSAADGTWRYSFQQPEDDGWMGRGFDDTSWPPMIRQDARRPPPDPGRDPDEYHVERLARLGAVGLGVRGTGTRVWVRKPFSIPEQDT